MGLVHGDDPEGWYGEGGGRGVSGAGNYVHPWWIHVDGWQNQYSIVKKKTNKQINKNSIIEVKNNSVWANSDVKFQSKLNFLIWNTNTWKITPGTRLH